MENSRKVHRKKLLRLIENQTGHETKITSLDMLFGENEIILYGAGSGFSTFSTFVLNQYGYKAHTVLDIKFQTCDEYYGVPAFSPHDFPLTDKMKKNALVIITIGKKKYHGEVLTLLRSLGFRNIMFASDIIEYHLHFTPKEYREKPRDYFESKKELILTCLEKMADVRSQEILIPFLETFIQKRVVQIPNDPQMHQYFPTDIELSKGCSRWVNCGSYDGDTIKILMQRYGKIESLVCFEPDLLNFSILRDYLLSNREIIAESVMSFPLGVYSDDKQFKLGGSSTNSSIYADEGNSLIQCVALDHTIPDFRPTYINMDIEGAEPEALKGAEKLIRENKPDLAVCVYHSVNHVWTILHYIDRLDLGYKFYLRNYTGITSETVLYATV